jgi:hypothetical protein
MVETRHMWFGHVERRLVDSAIRRVYQMEDSQITRGRGRPRKTMRETIKKDLEINELDKDIIYDRTLCRCLIHVANHTLWNKACLLFE